MTATAKIAHWVTIACLVYCAAGFVRLALAGSWVDILAVGIWSFLALMVYRRPRAWGFGVGLFLLLVVPAQAWLWRLGVTRMSPEEKTVHNISESWFVFWLSELPFIVGCICGIALRWLWPAAQQKQPPA